MILRFELLAVRAHDGDSRVRVRYLLANRRARAQTRDIGTYLYRRASLKFLIENDIIFIPALLTVLLPVSLSRSSAPSRPLAGSVSAPGFALARLPFPTAALLHTVPSVNYNSYVPCPANFSQTGARADADPGITVMYPKE